MQIVDGWNVDIQSSQFVAPPGYAMFRGQGKMKHPVTGEELNATIICMATPFMNLTIDSPKGEADVA